MIDEQALDQQTMGDRRLASELLEMFVAQLEAASVEMPSCSFERRAALSHMLKGTARSLGVDEVAACAAQLEARQAPDHLTLRLSHLAQALRREVQARRLMPG